MDGFKIDFSAFRMTAQTPEKPNAVKSQTVPEEPKDEQAEEHARTVQVFKTWDTQKKMRVMSEANLDDALDWHMEEGCAY
ncbi:hypothetical protein ELC62_29185, partial [Klebsiella pneumoniae]|nr:hypothetical protein [Klebsiella pneumoniae]